MKNLTISSLLSAAVFSVAFAAPITTASAAPYFACQPGYTFQVKNKAARCHRNATVKRAPLKRCPQITFLGQRIGTFYKKNHVGKKDMCVGVIRVAGAQQTNAINITCPSGYTKKIKPQKDTCEKRVRAANLPPVRAVSR